MAEEMQGIGAVARQKWTPLKYAPVKPAGAWLALETIQSPGNLGTIIRTCDAVGCAGLIFLDQSTDPFDPACVRATMGAIFSQRFVRASSTQFRYWKRRNNVQVIGTSADADIDYREVQFKAPTVLMLGWERKGLSERQKELCDTFVSIPLNGRADSLNVAVAAGIIMYEVFGKQARHETKTIKFLFRAKPRIGLEAGIQAIDGEHPSHQPS